MTAELALCPTTRGDGVRLPLATPLKDEMALDGSSRWAALARDCDRVVGRCSWLALAGEDPKMLKYDIGLSQRLRGVSVPHGKKGEGGRLIRMVRLCSTPRNTYTHLLHSPTEKEDLAMVYVGKGPSTGS